MILIGSRAFQLRAPSVLNRNCVDFDWVCTQPEFDKWLQETSHKVSPTKVYELPQFHKWIVEGSTNCEFEIITPNTSSELLSTLVDAEWLETSFGFIPPLDLLFAIKDSHKYKKFHLQANGFWKTAIDWHMMKSLGATIRPEYQEFHKLRQSEAYAGQKHPKLNVSKDNFFKDDGLQDTYIYDHDDIHQAVKLYEHPAYTYYLINGEEVKCSKEKFFSVSEEIRLAGGCEEALTLALERSQIPWPKVWTPDFSFHFALAKVASSITSGYFREYCYQHIFDIIKLYQQTSKNYLEKFEDALASGKIRPFSVSKY